MTRTNAWGREIDETRRNAFKRPIVETPPRKNAWGRELDETRRNAWGRPVAEVVRRSAWGRELEDRPETVHRRAQSAETTTEQEPTTPPKVERPQATKTTVVREAAGDPNDPLRPWSPERLATLKPGARIAIVRRGRGGRWAPAYGYKAG